MPYVARVHCAVRRWRSRPPIACSIPSWGAQAAGGLCVVPTSTGSAGSRRPGGPPTTMPATRIPVGWAARSLSLDIEPGDALGLGIEPGTDTGPRLAKRGAGSTNARGPAELLRGTWAFQLWHLTERRCWCAADPCVEGSNVPRTVEPGRRAVYIPRPATGPAQAPLTVRYAAHPSWLRADRRARI